MPTQPCSNEPQGSQIIAQTLFLGASVGSFNTSMGWGGQPSQLTVTLIDDSVARQCLLGGNTVAAQLPLSTREDGTLKAASDSDRFQINHYHTCSGDSCYVDDQGNNFNSSSMDVSKRMVPGKVYYRFKQGYNPSFVSQYWYNPDPGFFGQPNRIGLKGGNTSEITDIYNNRWQLDNNNLNNGYDIIDTPVMFKMGNFSFAGLVQNWTQQIGQGGKIYNVTINSMQSLLNSCYIILDNYAGAIYSKLAGSSPGGFNARSSLLGGPRNYTGNDGVNYFGRLYEGNTPNIFNVYGFLESFGFDGFGGSESTTEGISANNIVDALSVLTSSTNEGNKLTYYNTNISFSKYGKRTAFSPFGRILAKCMQENDTYRPIARTFDRFGVIPPTPVENEEGNRSSRCQFLLDLSEIPRLPNDVRISGPVISITDLLNQLAEKAGFDYYVDLVTLGGNDSTGSTYYNVIKVKTISRLSQPRTNLIENAIKEFQCAGYALSATTIGKEKNDSSGRSMIIGGPIQRLYQAKSLRLAYTQSNYIYNPATDSFVDYLQLGTITANNASGGIRTPTASRQFHHGKGKSPAALDNHNPDLSVLINPSYEGIYKHNNEIKKEIPSLSRGFDELDRLWTDNPELANNVANQISGNYGESEIKKYANYNQDSLALPPVLNQRFIPLFQDVICPFFGYVMETEQPVRTDGKNTDFRRIRPVWFDTWTGQIVVMLRTAELPETSVNMENLFTMAGLQYFTLTESEIRAALQGFDEFIVYCLSKTYKNDLIEMLRRSNVVKTQQKYIAEGLTSLQALQAAQAKHNWYWNLIGGTNVNGGNIAGPHGLTVAETADKIDGTYQLPQYIMSDLKILHSFVCDIGKYYGKKYMVTAPYLSGYKEQTYNRTITTTLGNAYVFTGGGEFKYTYTPTNDGAWEEYGNIIDDSMVVGGREWHALTDDQGKIKPLLAYNANDCFDIDQYNKCLAANANFANFARDRANPVWSFGIWDNMLDFKYANCDNNDFIFPGLDYSSLSPEDYLLFIYDTTFKARDAFGTELKRNGVTLPIKKLYVSSTVEDSFVFLDPENLKEPRILIEPSSAVHLNVSSNAYSQDPNRTILATVAMEDLAIYLRSNPNPMLRDYNFVNRLLSLIYTITDGSGSFLGNFNSSANKSPAYATLHPKAAHPLFAAVPLKSNVFSYGPWINYPYLEYLSDPQSVFPDGITIKQSDAIPPVCTAEPITINPEAAKRAVDNWILPTDVQVIEDYVPWNYGGMAFLDNVAFNDVRNRTNYQNVLETAQIDMPGLPLFNLGGTFSYGSFGIVPINFRYYDMVYDDVKFNLLNPLLNSPPPPGPVAFEPFIPTNVTDTIIYKVLQIVAASNNTGGPVITNIQTNVNQGGITTTYIFRTYTKKLGLFNKENSDRIKKINADNLRRNKQFAQISKNFSNTIDRQIRNLQNNDKEKGSINSKDFKSKLFGWSPVKVLIGQSYPYLQSLDTNPYRVIGNGNSLTYFDPLSTPDAAISNYMVRYGADIGDNSFRWVDNTEYLSPNATLPSLLNEIRQRTDVGLFEEKEVNAQIQTDYGLQGMMSLDGIFSPVSFYPTLKNSTFNFSLYDQRVCPFCNGSKTITIPYRKYTKNVPVSTDTGSITIYCDKCTTPSQALNIKLKSNTTAKTSSGQSLETLPPYIVTSGTDINTLLSYKSASSTNSSSVTTNVSTSNSDSGVNIPINLVSLQPIVVPYGEFRNPNVQSYEGIHPEGEHDELLFDEKPRKFYDRCRHSIEVVGRGSVNPENLNIAKNLKNYQEVVTGTNLFVNADYYDLDIQLSKKILDRTGVNVARQNNQRFMGLRGPLVLHGWGYDLEGYPVPNAADEPYDVDSYGRPQRFKLKVERKSITASNFSQIPNNESFEIELNLPYLPSPQDKKTIIVKKTEETLEATMEKDPEHERFKREYEEWRRSQNQNTTPGAETESQSFSSQEVSNIIYNSNTIIVITISDDLENIGGFDPAVYQGSIISKTQKWDGSKWSEKKKLKDFYLNWAERTDLWPVGPIDLRWDADRKVWATKSDSISSIYKMVYLTLEEDLVKETYSDETYPARAFLDDAEYSTEPLGQGYRRLVFVKDRAGYTAPRGAKLFCRYDKDSGFYEPVSKPSYNVKGIINNGTQATLEMSYVQGKKRGEINPTMLVNFENPFGFNTVYGNQGLFLFNAGKWTLTATNMQSISSSSSSSGNTQEGTPVATPVATPNG